MDNDSDRDPIFWMYNVDFLIHVASSVTIPNNHQSAATPAERRRIEIASGSLRGNLFGKREDYSYDVPDGVVHVSLNSEDKSDAGLNIGSGNGDVTLKWDKAARKAYVHAWVNGSIGSNHMAWTVYGWY